MNKLNEEGVRRHDMVAGVLLFLLAVSVLLAPLSWLGSAMGLPFRNLFSAEGIRWYYLHVQDAFHSPLWAVSIPLLLMAGAVERSGLAETVRDIVRHGVSVLTYRQRKAFWLALAFLLCYLAGLVLLLAGPHAILRSVTGRLFPSPFLFGLLQTVPLGVILVSLIYAVLSSHLRGLREYLSVLYWGIRQYAMLILILLLGIQLYDSFLYVAGDFLSGWSDFFE